jgi:Ca-activated chloride channel family protein
MLHRKVNAATKVLLVVAAASLFSLSAPCAGLEPADRGIRAVMSGPALESPRGVTRSLPLVRAHYHVEVIGSTATGTLEQEFRNDTTSARLATYTMTDTAGLRTTDLHYEINGELLTALETTAARPASEAGRSPAQRSSAPTDAAGMRGRAIELAADQTIIVRTGFRLEVPLVKGRSRLRLPVVLTAAPPGEAPAPRRSGADPRNAGEMAIRQRLETVPLSITINVHHDRSLTEVDSPSHELMVSFEGDRTVIEPARMGSRSRKAFDLIYSLGAEYEATLLVYAGPETEDGRQVVLELTPPSRPRSESIRSKQMLFVVDTSGSMSRGKLDQARRAITTCLEKLSYDDQYNIIGFANQATLLRPEPAPLSALHPSQAESWLESLEPKGGTRLLPALEETLRQPVSEGHHRMIVVLTDGLMVDEEKVLQFMETKLGAGRLFVVGIGNDVRRDTIRRLAEYGRGMAAFAADPGALEQVVAQLFDSVAAPLAWDLAIDWGGATSVALEPQRLPDLYAGRAVKAVARVSGDLPAEITMRGTTVDGDVIWAGPVRRIAGEALRGIPAPRQPAARDPGGKRKMPEIR